VLAALRRTSRDNARTPMQWTSGPHAGFTTGTPWITVNPNAADINAEAEVADPDSVFAHYRALIDLRHRSEVVAIGDYALVLPEHPQLFAYTRSLDDRSLLVLANLSSEPATFDAAQLPAWAVGGGDAPAAELVLSNLGSATEATSGSLRPWEAVVYSRG
jgi:oligo-1,6-glucosidase